MQLQHLAAHPAPRVSQIIARCGWCQCNTPNALSVPMRACLPGSQGYTVVHMLASMGRTKEVWAILNLAHLAKDAEVPDGDAELYRRCGVGWAPHQLLASVGAPTWRLALCVEGCCVAQWTCVHILGFEHKNPTMLNIIEVNGVGKGCC
jgi:hypothetical protein